MIDRVPSLKKLIHELNKLPSVGPKTAQRLAYFVLRSKNTYVEELKEALNGVKQNIRECGGCFSFTEDSDLCHYCSDNQRTDSVLCVVEDPADISRIESSRAFRGRYHVLHGAISPLDGISPQDLKIQNLIERIQQGLDGTGPKVEEVILALDADLEGDTTVLYLAKALALMDVKITRIAHGVPIGSDIDYIDHRTLERALENRVSL